MINLSDVRFEQAVLAALMSIEAGYDEVSGTLRADMFIADRHKAIYEAITAIKQQGGRVDALTVMEWLESRKRLAIAGGEGYLMKLLAESPASLFNLSYYVEKMQDLSVRRMSLDALNQAKDQIVNNPDRLACDVVSDAIGALGQASANGGDAEGVGMGDALKAQIARMEWLAANPDKCFGQPTGFIAVDGLIGGMSEGDLIIIGARPSMGKTTYAVNIVEHAASTSNLPWLVISLEMPTLQLTERILSSCAGVHLGNLRSGNLHEGEWVRYTSAAARLQDVPIVINDKGLQTLSEIRRQGVALKRKHGKIGGIMVDYIGLMGGIDQNNKVNSISVISAGLKALAKELACPVIALSQLNRGLEQRPNKRPMMADLRESGSIEQDADIIMFLYRDEVYNKESQAAGTAEIIVAKQRNGATGTAVLGFEGQYSRFTNLMGSYQGGDHD